MKTQVVLAARIESYLSELNAILHRWEAWLSQLERSAMEVDRHALSPNEGQADDLWRDLKQLATRRLDILQEASQCGWPADSLRSVSRSLGLWTQPTFLRILDAVEMRLAQLKRSHVSVWVLLKAASDYCEDGLMLLMSGRTRSDYTIDQMPPETGGHLLNADL